MKKWILWLIGGLVMLMVKSLVASAALTDGLVSYYSFDTNATDIHQGTYNGTNEGFVHIGSAFMDGGYEGDGSNDGEYVNLTIPSTIIGSLEQNWSFQIWFNTSASAYGGLVNAYYSSDNGDWLFYVIDTGMAEFYVRGGSSITTTTAVNNGTWVHAVINHYSTSDNVTMYINGVRAVSGLNLGIVTSNQPIVTGAYAYGPWEFNGVMDEIGFWNRTLSQSEITDLYNSGNGYAYPFTPANTAPTTPTLISPTNNSYFNALPVVLNYSSSDVDGDTITYYVYINGTLNGTSTLNWSFNASDGNYTWNVAAYDGEDFSSNSTIQQFSIDTVVPTITWRSPVSDNSSTTSSDIYQLNVTTTDINLFRSNLTVFHSNGTIIYNNYSGDIIAHTTWNFTDNLNLSNWTDQNFTIEVSTTDDHTLGGLRGLTYNIENDGIKFCRGENCKKIYAGYWHNNDYHFLTSQQIQDYNIDFGVVSREGEYKYDMSFKRPATDIKFGFAVPKIDGLILRERGIGHFVWRDWYLDFNDLIGNNFVITVKEINDYWVVYTSTQYCSVNVGEICTLDPVVGGLNTVTEHKLLLKDTQLPNVTIAVNNTLVSTNDFVNISSNATDNIELSHCIFWNDMSSINSTPIALSGVSDTCSNVTSINATAGTAITFRVYVNDTANNWNETSATATVIAPFNFSIIDRGMEWIKINWT